MIITPCKDIAIRQAEDAETLGSESVTMRLLIDAEEAGGALSNLEVTMAPGADGAAPHYHTQSDELFYIADGELQLLAGNRIVTVGAGARSSCRSSCRTLSAPHRTARRGS